MSSEDGNKEGEQRKKRGKGERNSQSNSSPPTSRASLTMATPAFYETHLLDLLICPERGQGEEEGRRVGGGRRYDGLTVGGDTTG
jgi:hypothetical protein